MVNNPELDTSTVATGGERRLRGSIEQARVRQQEDVSLRNDADIGEGNGMQGSTRSCLLIVAGLLTLSVTSGWAFDCPNMHQAMTAYYEKTAKVSGADQAKLTQGKQMLDDSMKKHGSGQHKDAIKEMANALNVINDARP
jgi:hypothetical protein